MILQHYIFLAVFSDEFACTGKVIMMRKMRILGSGRFISNFVSLAKEKRITICRCCWLATKPFSDYEMIETQVMVTPKKMSVDVHRMHLEYKWELPINHGTFHKHFQMFTC